jgi:hypothetical protein
MKNHLFRASIGILIVTIFSSILGAQVNRVQQPVPVLQQGSGEGQVFVLPNGQGAVQLFWLPGQGSRWPAGGWRILDGQNNVIADRITAGASAALKALSTDEQALLQKLLTGLASNDASARQKSLGLAAAYSMRDPDFARAMGLTCTLLHVSAGQHQYKIVGLSSSGSPSEIAFVSSIVDTSVVPPLPPAPRNLTAQIVAQGVALYWSPGTEWTRRDVVNVAGTHVVAYWVERDGFGRLTGWPRVLGATWKAEMPGFIDTAAPADEEHDYSVFSVDVFGRISAPATVHVSIPDIKAMTPPTGLTATAGANKITLSWTPNPNPNTTGYVVERSQLPDGPFEPLTMTALPPTTTTYEDDHLLGGATYFYQVRSMEPGGELGVPAHAASATPTNATNPPAPVNFQATSGNSIVHLSWEPVSFAVAGYFIERLNQGASPTVQASGLRTGAQFAASPRMADTRWRRLNARLVKETRFDDELGTDTYGTLTYRVIAVGTDSKESEPSKIVEATLENPSLPVEPTITSIDGTGGKVILRFRANGAAEQTTQFLVMRSPDENDEGLVIGDPIAASVQQFTDDAVSAGQHYWYRVVAFDAAGNRSDPSTPANVRVGAPPIPKPATPTVRTVGAPFPMAEISFVLPGAGLAVMVQVRRGSSGRWITLAGPIEDKTTALDSAFRSDQQSAYRIVFRAANNQYGEPSEAVEAAGRTVQ